MPRDAPSPLVSDTEFRGKAISLRRFGEYMREARAKHVLAVFDSCFGGSVFNVARALQPPPAITHATALPVRQFISSGDADQEVSDDGTFRRLFIDALQGAEPAADVNKDGYLTGTGLGQFLYTKMTNLTGQRQTPRYGKLVALGYDRGDFVFQVREPKAGAAPKASADAARQPLGEAAQAWADIKELKNVAVFEAFRKQYGAANPLYDTLASQRIEELKAGSAPGQGGAAASWWPWGAPGPQPQPAKPPETQAAVVVPKPPPAPPKPAETQTAVSVTVGTSAPVGVAVPIGTAVPVGVSVPTSKPEPACDGLLVSVAVGKNPCIKPGSGKSFRDCPDCPEMVVVPEGSFTMGSPADEKERYDDEGPQHKVTISKPFAVGKFVVTFDEWDACVSGGGCERNPSPSDEGWGKGRRPVINVNWDDAQEYVNWLSRKTRQKYRLLSEAEWEYAARAGTRTRYFWGNSLGRNNAKCNGCGSEGDNKKTAEVGQFQPNAFGLYDMAGNVWQRTEDCWNDNYNGAPDDGSAVTTGYCRNRVLRGGYWADDPRGLRSAARFRGGGWGDLVRGRLIGFRVARTF